MFVVLQSCRILDALSELRDDVCDALERVDGKRGLLEEHITVLNLMTQKAAQKMCYKVRISLHFTK